MTSPDCTPAWVCRCPSCVAADAVALLEGARADMALTVLRDLHESITVAVEAAYAAGFQDGRRAGAKGRTGAKRAASAAKVIPRGVTPPAPAFAKLASELAAHVEDLGADRVAEALGVALDDLDLMLEGRVSPSASGLRRLREASE